MMNGFFRRNNPGNDAPAVRNEVPTRSEAPSSFFVASSQRRIQHDAVFAVYGRIRHELLKNGSAMYEMLANRLTLEQAGRLRLQLWNGLEAFRGRYTGYVVRAEAKTATDRKESV